jgi:SAM-dependent methyltransferase
MHKSAWMTGAIFFQLYSKLGDQVLDVGSLDVNGTLRDAVPQSVAYIGADIVAGKNVDVVLSDPHVLPLDSNRFDLVISSSCLEHDEFFWLTFAEMARVVRPGGFIYLSAPVQGPVHRHPIDAWRFYPDAGKALARWAQRQGQKIELVESFLLQLEAEFWQDFVAVFGKAPFTAPQERLSDRFPSAQHRT